MVRCKMNHEWLYENIKDKVWDRYYRKYKDSASNFPEYDPADADDSDSDLDGDM